jgi:hypothetical protein
MAVDRSEQQRVVERFLAAVRTGDVAVLMDVLAPDAVLIADGGGVVQAVRQPGARKISNLIRNFPVFAPAVVPEPVLGFAFENGRISRILTVRNPQKLMRVEEETALSR